MCPDNLFFAKLGDDISCLLFSNTEWSRLFVAVKKLRKMTHNSTTLCYVRPFFEKFEGLTAIVFRKLCVKHCVCFINF